MTLQSRKFKSPKLSSIDLLLLDPTNLPTTLPLIRRCRCHRSPHLLNGGFHQAYVSYILVIEKSLALLLLLLRIELVSREINLEYGGESVCLIGDDISENIYCLLSIILVVFLSKIFLMDTNKRQIIGVIAGVVYYMREVEYSQFVNCDTSLVKLLGMLELFQRYKTLAKDFGSRDVQSGVCYLEPLFPLASAIHEGRTVGVGFVSKKMIEEHLPAMTFDMKACL
ncbi:hypothetical protein R6Q59_031513 [Mikania micrantha]